MNIKQEPKYDAIAVKEPDNAIDEIGDRVEGDYKTLLINRATGEVIPEDEPIFILRAKDTFAIPLLWTYMEMAHRNLSGDQTHKKVILKRLDDFEKFKHEHPDRMGEPDTDKSVLESMESA